MSTIILNPQIFGGTNSNVPTPFQGELALGFDQDNLLKYKDSDGNVHIIGGGSGGTGSSIDQNNIIKTVYIHFTIGGRGNLQASDELINNRLQEYFDYNDIIIEDTEIIMFDVYIINYNQGFQTNNRKYLLVNKGKGSYGPTTFNVLQVETDIVLVFNNGDVTTTPTDLLMDINNIIYDLGNITGSDYVDYINNNGTIYNLSDSSKIYYFRFISNGIEYVYYFEGNDSVNGYGIYGFLQLQIQTTPVPDLVLFYDDSLPVISTPNTSQDNSFRYCNFKVTLLSKDLNITYANTINLLRDQVNYVFQTNNLQILDNELIIFQFYIYDLRNSTKYIWRYFNKHKLGKGVYAPIYNTITFDDLKLANADNIIEFINVSDITTNPNNIIFDLGDITTPLINMSFIDYLNTYTPPFDLTNSDKIYYFKFIDNGITYMYYYIGNVYGNFGLSNSQFSVDELILFYDSSLYNTNIVSPIDNIPVVYDILSTDINKSLKNITESDVVNYINGVTGTGIFVSEQNSMAIFNVYQPSIDIWFNNINTIGVIKTNDIYSWNSWIAGHTYTTSTASINFEFSEVKINGNTASLIGDLNDLVTFSINTIDINNIIFGKSRIKNVYLDSITYTTDLSNLEYLENVGITGASTSNVPIGGKNIKTLRITGNNTLGVSIVVQGTYSVPSNYYITSPLTSLSFQNILSKLVLSPTGNTGSFGMTSLSTYISGNTYSADYVSTLTTRGWYFYGL